MPDNLNKDLRVFSSSKMFEALLKAAAGRMGTDPETLRRRLESGELENSIKNASAGNESMQKLKAALSDPKAAEKLMNDPRAAEILKNLEASDLEVMGRSPVRKPRRRLAELPGQMTFL